MGWISTQETLPDECINVLCYFGSHTPYEVGTYSGHNGRWHVWQAANGNMHEFDCDPTHWMPLPEPPAA
jgi:hypothetical protein